MDHLELLDRATRWFTQLVDTATADQWELPTPCDEWNAGDLVDHVIGGNWFTTAILNGARAEDALKTARARFSDADDRKALARASFIEQTGDFARPGSLEQICHHEIGDIPGSVVLGLRLMDVTIHGWDLARSLGADETIPADVVAAVWVIVSEDLHAIAASGAFGPGPSPTLLDDADLQTRLLDATGRRP